MGCTGGPKYVKKKLIDCSIALRALLPGRNFAALHA
jgi:hypothetical protein